MVPPGRAMLSPPAATGGDRQCSVSPALPVPAGRVTSGLPVGRRACARILPWSQQDRRRRPSTPWNGSPRAAGAASRRSASATGCCARAAASPGGPTRRSSSATRPSRWTRRRRRRPTGTPARACGPGPGAAARRARRPTPRFAAAGWERGEDVLVLTAALGGLARPRGRRSTSLRRRTTPGWPATATAAPRCRRWPPDVLTQRRASRSSPPSGWTPRRLRLAAVARGVARRRAGCASPP